MVYDFLAVKTGIKKITSLFFILLGFTPLLFTLFVTIKKQEIRHRMKEKLERQHLQTIILAENQVVWMDKHEIWVNDHMFDIHNSKLESGVYTFTGLYDEEETILVEKQRNTTGKNNEQHKLLDRLFKYLKIFWSQPAEINDPVIPCGSFNSFNSPESVNPFREIFTPPPQVDC